MANVNAPFGFRWHGLYGDASPPTSGLTQLKVASTDTSVYGEGDPLMFLGTGYVTALTATTIASQFAGVFKSCKYFSTSQGRTVWRNYWPGTDATGDVTVNVEGAGLPQARWLVQSAGVAAITIADVNGTVDIAAGSSTAGSVVGGYYKSACTIGLQASVGVTATLPFRIVGLWSDIGAPGSPGTSASAYNWVLVESNTTNQTGV